MRQASLQATKTTPATTTNDLFIDCEIDEDQSEII